MHIKIQEQQIRLKISAEELTTLATLPCVTCVGNLCFTLCCSSSAPAPQRAENSTHMAVELTSAQYQQLKNMGRSKEGLCVQTAPYHVYVQVDLRSDKRPAKRTTKSALNK